VGEYIWQRFCTQHSVKLAKMESIFLTHLDADTLGGLLGMYLTLADSGNRRLSVHGPPGVSHFLSAGKAFCENREVYTSSSRPHTQVAYGRNTLVAYGRIHW
jgi:ribonuclease Z